MEKVIVYYDGGLFEKYGKLHGGYRAMQGEKVLANNFDDSVRIMAYLTQILNIDVSRIEYAF